MIRQRFLALAVAVCGVVGLAFVPATAAPLGCQPARAALQYVYVASDGHLAVWHRECSGEYSLNSLGYIVQTRGWSGCVYTNTGRNIPFNPNKDVFIQGRVIFTSRCTPPGRDGASTCRGR